MIHGSRAISHRADASPSWDLVLASTLSLFAFVLYLATMPPSITWQHGGQDSGNLAAAVHLLGIPHPSGYPTYVLLGKLFSLIPAGDTAFRLNIMSAAFAAATVFLVYQLVRELRNQLDPPGSKWPAYGAAFGALSLAVSPLFWTQAIVVEVYSLNAFFFTAILFLLARRRRLAERGDAYLWLAGLLFGAGLGNHLSLLALVPAGLGILWSGPKGSLPSRGALVAPAALALAGLAVYLLLPLRAGQNPAANWGDPSTLDRFAWLVSGGEYRYLLQSVPTPQVLSRLAGIGNLLLGEFAIWGTALGLIGIWRGYIGRLVVTAGLGASFLLLSVYAAMYGAENSQVYLLPAFILWSVWIGWGVEWLMAVVQLPGLAGLLSGRVRRVPGAPVRERVTPGWVPGTVAAILLLCPMAFVVSSWDKVDLRNDSAALDYGIGALAAVPEGSLVLSSRDEHTFSLDYSQQVLGRRPDVVVVDVRLLKWDWYRENLRRRFPDLSLELGASGSAVEAGGILADNLDERACFTTTYDTGLLTTYALRPHGLLYEVNRR